MSKSKAIVIGVGIGAVAMMGISALGQNTGQTGSAPAALVTSAATASPEPSATPSTTARVGSSVLEQAIFDAFPSSPPQTRKERKTASQAADLIGVTINLLGHLCARPIQAQRASYDMYGVACITHKGGYGRSNYLVNTRTGEVTEI